ncbi:hypothetical protein [Streptomyces sp. CB03238]|uniref:hypothetical protein n=1 Tax=Streptomyces sp. CB03238 TaxID=1907777 RepID=UPI000A1093D7|nr:hypothetical protein [Streptomyces sp. CB03238]ORT55581.1 hypothetical protein BKD26_31205 [Streptomyces sp. CB03238]
MTSVVIDMWIGRDVLVLQSQETGKGAKGTTGKEQVLIEEHSGFGTVPAITPPPGKDRRHRDEFIARATRP